ncbi:hypothetical protein F53441_13014 [Fusarium austroafricanum]|uniref:Prion-inhibition and propagation HeLo domain-containing protein n=1 Tax=Fusarium austroafricanum TaxID=2364996 RepID=A0A8H4NJM3_9HYPO|nr:hypothetical protein F53441_13014 [Fusarium austroafricanum]
MEAAGLAIGIVGIAGLFNTCLDAVSKFQTYKSSNSDAHMIDTRFRAAKARFEQWGVSVGLSRGGLLLDHHAGLDNKETGGVVEDILQIIIKAICDDSNLHRSNGQSRSRNGSYAGLTQSRRRRLKWAIGGKEDRIDQVQMFEKLVQQLYNLVPPKEEQGEPRTGLQSQIWTEDIREVLNKIEDGIKAEVRREVFFWLGRSPPSDKFEDSKAERVRNTCDWIFHRPAFQTWLSQQDPSKPSLLWINGPAGFGKTILCAHIVEHLSSMLSTPLAYFFFASDHESRENPFFALRSWISQVVEYRDNAFECIRQAWDADAGSTEMASRRTLVDLFNKVAKTVPGCVFIADGLDECSQLGTGESSLAAFLSEITAAAADTNVRLLLVSRDEPDIRRALEDSTTHFFCEYRIKPEDVEADTAAFSRSLVDRKLPNKSEDIKGAISEAMADRCEGQFLWIKMQEESLRKGMSKKRLHQVIENTPSGLDRLYDHNWKRIAEMPQWERDRVHALLRWAAFAMEPLTVYEITEAVLITQFEELDPEEYPDDIDDDYVKTEIVGLCGPLLEVKEDPKIPSPGYRTVHMPHFSVRQYLTLHLPTPIWIQPNNQLQMSYERVHHTVIAKACVQYLGLSQVWKEEYNKKTIHESLRLYVTTCWIEHARQGFSDSTAFEISKHFLEAGNPLFNSMIGYLMHHRIAEGLIRPGEIQSVSPLRHVLNYRWTDMAEYLISQVDVNEVSSDSTSPIFWACSAGSTEIVNKLLQLGADLNVTDCGGRTPLHTAAFNGFEGIVETLLKYGHDPSPQDKVGNTPMHLASFKGHVKCCRYLIESGADLTIRNNGGSTILYMVCRLVGQAEVLRMILQNGPRTLATDPHPEEGPPLAYVSILGDVEMAKILFDYGAATSLFVPDVDGWFPLLLAADEGHVELVKLFLEHGGEATLSSARPRGQTLLHTICHRARKSDDEMIKLCMRPGIEPSFLMKDHRGRTPLHIASINGRIDIVRSVLQYQAPDLQALFEAKDKYSRTPLFIASYRGHLHIVQELLRYGAQTAVSIFDIDNNSPLFVASEAGYSDIVQELLRHGAGETISVPNKGGWTPLSVAIMGEFVEIAKILLQIPGVPVNQKDNYGMTPLFIASRFGNQELVRLLLSHSSIDLECKDWVGSTPLFGAVANGHLEIAKLLISKGATVHSQAAIGKSLLWWARRTGSSELTELLVAQTTMLGDAAITNQRIFEPPPEGAEKVKFSASLGWHETAIKRRGEALAD